MNTLAAGEHSKKLPFHEFLRIHVDSSDIKQLEMAEAMGFAKPNIITMFKQGKTRVPLDKVPAFARVLGLDSRNLLRMAMSEYCPELLAVCEKEFGAVVSRNEQKFLDIMRDELGGFEAKIMSKDDEEKVRELARSLLKRA